MAFIERVTHISYSSSGGAGEAAKDLCQALVNFGVKASLEPVTKSSVSHSPMSNPAVTLAALIDKFIIAKPNAALFSPVRGSFGSWSKPDTDVLHLHWTTGAIGLSNLEELLVDERAIFWTLHDFRPLSGGCHYPKSCLGYETVCKACPQSKAPFRGIVSRTRETAAKIISSPNLFLIAPSEGIRQAAIRAGAKNVVKIPNPIDTFWIERQPLAPEKGSSLKFIFVAANVQDPIKGLQSVLQWWSSRERHFESLSVVGANSELFEDRAQGVYGLGSLDKEGLAEALDAADILLFASTEDNAPGVIAQAVARGLPVFCLNRRMELWLKKDRTPLISESDLQSVTTFRDFYCRDFLDLRGKFLAARSPNLVAACHVELYGLTHVPD